MTSKARVSSGALLVAALCAACGGGKSALTPVGDAGPGGHTGGAAGQSGEAQPVASDGAAGSASADAAGSADAAAGPVDSIEKTDGGDDLAKDALRADAAPLPRFAANGVPIPPPALPKDSCAFLAVETVRCNGDGQCPTLSCDCGGSTLTFDMCFGKCVAGISCPAACALGSSVLPGVLACLDTTVCKSDSDCQQVEGELKCLVPPNAPSGECISGLTQSPCLANADCVSQACVVTADGPGVCSTGDGACNIDAHCSTGSHCTLAPGAFAGICTSGVNGNFCVTQSDCQPSLQCEDIFAQGNRECTSRGKGAPCVSNADCNNGFCVDSTCDTGAVGARCESPSQCHLPFCVNVTCSQGAPGDVCQADADCQGFCASGLCSDGALGQPCRFDHSGCIAGLHCPPTGPLICVES